VADFEAKLQQLSVRGTPVGAEELIERIEAELAGDPLVVVFKQREGAPMTTTDERVTTGGPGTGRGLAWAIAAFVAILTMGALYFAFSGGDGEVVDQTTVFTPTPTLLQGDVLTRPLEPGAYLAYADGDPTTAASAIFLVEGAGWEGGGAGLLRDNTSVLLHLHQVPEPVLSPECTSTVPMPAQPSAADLADAFASSGFTVLEAPAAVSAFGLEGQHVKVEVADGCVLASYLAKYGTEKLVHPGDVLDTWLFDIDGHIVMVEALVQQGRGVPTEDDLAALSAAIDSLVVTPSTTVPTPTTP